MTWNIIRIGEDSSPATAFNTQNDTLQAAQQDEPKMAHRNVRVMNQNVARPISARPRPNHQWLEGLTQLELSAACHGHSPVIGLAGFEGDTTSSQCGPDDPPDLTADSWSGPVITSPGRVRSPQLPLQGLGLENGPGDPPGG